MNNILHSFPGQESNEPVFVFARSYFIAFLPTLGAFLIILIFTFFLEYLLLTSNFSEANLIYGQIAMPLLGAVQLFALILFFTFLFNFYYSLVIVTDRRLVNIDQGPIFNRRISELQLEEIEDVTSDVAGFFPTLFNYGTVFIQTAGTQDNFNMENIRFPREVSALVLSLSEQAKKNVPEEDRLPQTNPLGMINNNLIASLEELQQVGAILPNDLRRVSQNPTPPTPPADAPPGI